jgi:uncharacterized protein
MNLIKEYKYMIYLDDTNIKIVKAILKEHLANKKVVVFGSRVKGTIKPYSDLDLCIMDETPLSLEQLGYLKEAFSESDLPIRVDIVEWAKITPEFKDVINQCFETIS